MAYIKKVNSLDGQTTYDIKAMAVEEGAAVQNTSGNMTSGAAVRNISYGSNDPTGGNNGDIYLQLQGSNSLIDLIYPIGSIYISTNSTNPGTWMPGTTWESISNGRFLIGAGSDGAGLTYTGGDTGGEAFHQLTVAEIPEHNHSIHGLKNYPTTENGRARFAVQGDGNLVSVHLPSTIKANTGTGGTLTSGYSPVILGQNGGYTDSVGDGVAHNNLPPYLVVYMWRRVQNS